MLSAARCHGFEIECITLHDAPFGIESDADVLAAAPLVVAAVQERQADVDAFVIACYSDPGLDTSRDVSVRPVYGIQESALREASRDGRFGVLALSEESIKRHLVYVEKAGVSRHVGERALGITVEEGVNDPSVLDKIVAEGRRLIEAGAETLVLGCAGLTTHRQAAGEVLGVPVIDPVFAAVDEAKTQLGVANATSR